MKVTLHTDQVPIGMSELIGKLMFITGKTSKEVVAQQGGLLVKQLMDLTPPTSGKGKASGSALKRIGEISVDRDIRKVFAEPKNIKWNTPDLQRNWDAGRFNLVKKILGEKHWLNRYQIIDRPSTRLRSGERDKRGRIRLNKKNIAERYLVTNGGALAQYIAAQQKRVGQMRAGWLGAMDGFNRIGSTSKKTTAPAFVKRHNPRGSFQRVQTEYPGVIYRFSNATPGIAGANRDMRIAFNAINFREINMGKNYQTLLRTELRKAQKMRQIRAKIS